MTIEDRRLHTRRPLHLIVNVETTTQLSAHAAVAKDASANGLLLNYSRKLEVGQAVKLTLQLPGDHMRQLTAKVVRCERNRAAEISLWRYLAAGEIRHALKRALGGSQQAPHLDN